MIFHPDLAAKVLDGTKTQTRRRSYPYNDGPCRYEVGRDYAVQPGRGKRAVGRILVTDVRCEGIGFLTEDDARREGFEDCATFYERWRQMYGAVDGFVWVITFELVAEGDGAMAVALPGLEARSDLTSGAA